MLKQLITGLMLISLNAALSSAALADYRKYSAEYEVTITNITPGQTFTPQLVVTHPRSVSLFELGEPASTGLEILAEGGNTAPLTEAIEGAVFEATTIGGLLGPGETATVKISSYGRRGVISMAAMMIPTNDAFVALDSLRLPYYGKITRLVPAYDAGTEYNDQSCQNMPGPRCGGEGYSAEPSENDEGFVHIGNGFHELGDFDANGFEILGPQTYDWRNSVARVTVKRIR